MILFFQYKRPKNSKVLKALVEIQRKFFLNLAALL